MDSMSDGNERNDIDRYTEKMVKLKKSLFFKANTIIKDSQARQKRDYDKKHHQKSKLTCTTGMSIAINKNVVLFISCHFQFHVVRCTSQC